MSTPETPTDSRSPDDALVDAWLVWSNEHNAWWRQNRAGYTDDIRAAGVYSHDEAHHIVENACPRAHSTLRPGAHPEVAVTLLSALEGFNDAGTVGGLLYTLAARLRELGAEQQRLIDDDVYLVRVPGVLVRRMRTLPLQPVTLRIEDRAGRELELIATEHICPSESPAP